MVDDADRPTTPVTSTPPPPAPFDGARDSLPIPLGSGISGPGSLSTDATEVMSGQSTPASQHSGDLRQTSATPAAATSPANAGASEPNTNGTAAAPYGTRSRNRNTSSRPNYAEDREVEMDYEMTGPASTKEFPEDSSPTYSPTQAQNHDSLRAAGVSTRRSSAAVHSQSTSLANGSLDARENNFAVPKLATMDAPEPSMSRKRKAIGSAVASQIDSYVSSQGRRVQASSLSDVRATSNMATFTASQAYLIKGKLKADDGTLYSINDTVFLVCEPPGEPYYMGRIMEFLHSNNDHKAPIEQLRMNWFYRPRDIHRKSTDTRYLFATMHSETSPLTSLRGKCTILHKSEVADVDELRKKPDSFWYDKMYDRYIMRFYDVIASSQVINVPPKIKRVLDEQWKYLAVEPVRGKELTSAAQSCKRCSGFCASNDSVECAVCHQTYHMNCVRPPLLKKPSRGFAWACAPCNRAQERRLEARNVPVKDGDEDEVMEEEEDEAHVSVGADTSDLTPYYLSETGDIEPHPVATAEQKAHAKLWPFRYLGIHCEVTDLLDFDDRIYPRASSRLGPRHQANVLQWHGRPFELVKAADIKRKYIKTGTQKKDTKLTKETVAALEEAKAERELRPKWVIDAPPGYVKRGEDTPNTDSANTARMIFALPEIGDIYELNTRGEDLPGFSEKLEHLSKDLTARETLIDEYMERAKLLAPGLNLPAHSTNFLTKAIEILYKNEFRSDDALKELRTMRKKKDLREPDFKPDELKRFEEGVSKYGTDLASVQKLIKSQPIRDVIRFYYVWKKTERGKLIWGNFEGRRNKKESKRSDSSAVKMLDDVADDHDDSAFDDDKIMEKKRGFQCKFCDTRHSRRWRRAPGVTPGTTIPADATQKPNKDRSNQLVVALCQRCGELWRRYGIQWEELEEVARKVAQGGGKAWKRRIDEELLKELAAATDPVTGLINGVSHSGQLSPTSAAAAAAQAGFEPFKKKLKAGDASAIVVNGTNGVLTGPKKKMEKIASIAPPPTPEPPKPKALPCAICRKLEPQKNEHLQCRECRLTVHRACYGVGTARAKEKWTCDMCVNDKNPQISTSYGCVLCPTVNTEQGDIKRGRGKKSDKDVEKERIEREFAEAQRLKQIELNKPSIPRDPLKPTVGNNWVHVVCAVWTPEIRFGRSELLEPAEGVGNIPTARFEQVCKVCKLVQGACVACHQCHAPVHVTCAQKANYVLGFDITPVKSSRRDQVHTVSLGGETGVMTAAIWCKEHPPKTTVHTIDEMSLSTGLNALQLFVRNYRQADLTLTGTVRKANLAIQSTKAPVLAVQSATSTTRRSSVLGSAVPKGCSDSPTSLTPKYDKIERRQSSSNGFAETVVRCVDCGVDSSPHWYPASLAMTPNRPAENGIPTPYLAPDVEHTNGGHHRVDSESMRQISSQANGTSGSEPPLTPSRTGNMAKIDTNVGGRAAVICHKCHWRKKRGEPQVLTYTLSEAAQAILKPMPRLRPETPPPQPPRPAQFPPSTAQQHWPPPPVPGPMSPATAFNHWPQPPPLGPHGPHGSPPQMHGLPPPRPQQGYSYAPPPIAYPQHPEDRRQGSMPPQVPHPMSVSLPQRRDYGPPPPYAMASQPYAHVPGGLPMQHQHYGHPHGSPPPPSPLGHPGQPDPLYARQPYNGPPRFSPPVQNGHPQEETQRVPGGGASAKPSLANILH